MKKYLSILGLALLVMFAFSALAAGTASAKEPTWWVCKTGTPQDAECPTGEKETELLAGEELEFTSRKKVSEPPVAKRLKAVVLGTEIVIECAKETDKGKIIGGRPGKDTVTSDVFEECVVTKPAGCVVGGAPKTITLNTPIATTLRWRHKGQFKEPATETEAEAKEALDQFVPPGGAAGKFTEFTFTNCGLLNGKHEVVGEALALLKPVAKKAQVAELEFPCSLITKYWTGDTPNGKSARVEHTIKPLELITPIGNVVVSEFCETKEVELVNKKRFGVFPAEKTL